MENMMERTKRHLTILNNKKLSSYILLETIYTIFFHYCKFVYNKNYKKNPT